MSDNDFTAYEARYAAFRALSAEILPTNKRTLLDALAASGIVLVVVAFEGSGDSGQIDSVEAFDASNSPVALPATSITVRTVSFETLSVAETSTTIAEFVEALAFDLLQETHSGWEDNEGAYGEFRFSVRERSITLEYHKRYIETHYHEHGF
ncbi:MAG: DUF6878 family protein [Acetobacteraceae bacterium]